MMLFYSQDRERHHLLSIDVKRSDNLPYDVDMELWVTHAAGCAGVKLIKGKLELGKKYLVSRGERLGWGLKPAAVIEYPRSWPWDYCYVYKL